MTDRPASQPINRQTDMRTYGGITLPIKHVQYGFPLNRGALLKTSLHALNPYIRLLVG